MTTSPSRLIQPFSGTLVDPNVPEDAADVRARANRLPSMPRRGEITGFTGIDDPYEAPENPEITLDTVVSTPDQNARRVLEHLERQGFVR